MQTEIVNIEDLVSKTHSYRKFKEILDFRTVEIQLRPLKKDNPNEGYGLLCLFKICLLQHLEDLSDRQMERFMQENTAGKWFCEFGLVDRTPSYTVLSKFRHRLGASKLSEIFAMFRDQLKSHGLMNEVFTFIDASSLISKASLWEERDEVIKQKYEKLNNETLPKVAKDKQAKIGCKGKNKHWYGFKKHISVDMQSGLINKVAVTPANLTDANGLKHVKPQTGAIYADKGYCVSPAVKTCQQYGLHLRAIKKNNMKDKNTDLDKWISAIRSPYERVFSQQNKRVRFKGIAKNQFAEFMNAICFNLKRIIVLNPPPFSTA